MLDSSSGIYPQFSWVNLNLRIRPDRHNIVTLQKMSHSRCITCMYYNNKHRDTVTTFVSLSVWSWSFFPVLLVKHRPVPAFLWGSPPKVYSSPTVSRRVTVSIFESHQCRQSSFGLQLELSCSSNPHHQLCLSFLHPRGAFPVSDEETNKQTLAVIRVTLFRPPATCKLLWMFSICSIRRPRLVLA